MAWDTDRPYHYLRWTEDGRLLVGGEDTSIAPSKGSRGRIAKARGRLMTYLRRSIRSSRTKARNTRGKGYSRKRPMACRTSASTHATRSICSRSATAGNGMTASFLAARLLVDLYQQRDKARKARQLGNLFAFDRGRR